MEIRVLFFGRLGEIAGTAGIIIENVRDIAGMNLRLHELYPAFADLKYLVAVDKQVVSGNKKLTDKMTIALLPPFSGG